VGEHRGVRRMPLKEAADALGISKDAVRQRVRRGTLRSDKGEDGRVYVYLDGVPDADRPAEQDQASDLTDELRDRLHYVEQQLEAERQAHAEARRIIAGLVERVPALEAPSEARESPESSGPAGGRGEAWEELDTERARREMAESTLREGMAEEQRRREEAERERDDLRRELFARREPRESPEKVEEKPERAEPRPDAPGAQEGARRPWWRRVFGR
jgi:hypothetical protein